MGGAHCQRVWGFPSLFFFPLRVEGVRDLNEVEASKKKGKLWGAFDCVNWISATSLW